jgi:hypothetical protein
MSESVVLWVLAAVVLVLLGMPLWRRRGPPAAGAERSVAESAEDDPAALALREIELDRAMGKLSESDYAALRAKYEAAAAARTPAAASSPAPVPPAGALEDRAEALVRHWRERRTECPECGVRPEPDARYCSNCGRRLAPCPACGRQVTEPGALHCAACGASLAA